ncbi:MAG: hypothetical protein EBX41_09620, partial [Chitinophagia bacterium]|nr:hypothetical protein [Chitinophagia bacterium]
MNHNYTSIDKLYKNGLGDYTEAPPPDVWESLDKRLDKRRKRYPFPFFWWCMAGLMLLLVGGGAYTYFNNLSIQNTELTTTTPSTVPATVAVGNAMPSVPVVATDANNGNVQEKISPAPHKPTVSATTKAEQKDNVNDDPLSNSLEEAEEVAPHPIAKANNYDALYEDAEASTNVTVLNSGTHNNISYAETEEAYTPNFADNQEENHTYGYAKPKVTPHKAQPTTTPAIAKHQTTIHHKTNKPHHTAAKAVAHKKQTTKPTPIAFAAKTNPTKVATKTNPIAVAAKANPTKVATKPNPISVAAKTNPTKVATKLTPIAVAAQPNPTKVATKPNPIAVAAKANPTKVATK